MKQFRAIHQRGALFTVDYILSCGKQGEYIEFNRYSDMREYIYNRFREEVGNDATKLDNIYDTIRKTGHNGAIKTSRGYRVIFFTSEEDKKQKLDKLFSSASICSEYEVKPANIAKEKELSTFDKMQVKFYSKRIKSLEETVALEDHIVAMFNSRVQAFSPERMIKEAGIVGKVVEGQGNDEDLVLCLADWHLGERVSYEQTQGINEYSTDIAINRVNNLYKAVTSVTSKLSGYNFNNLYIFILGDMVGGIIHEELIENSEPLVDQVLLGGELIADLVLNLSSVFKTITVTGVVGNHGRVSKKPYFKNKYNNFDYLIYKFAEVRCSSLKNVTFNIPKSAMTIQTVNGFNFLLRHGDMKVSTMAGIPYYGLARAESTFYHNYHSRLGIVPHYSVMGHLHQSAEIPKAGGKLLLCGTLKGTDEYSLNSGYSISDPSQLLFSVHPTRGVTLKLTVDVE